jgi:hypothetical protein
MLYVYIALIALGVDAVLFAGLCLFMRWLVPRYGVHALRLAMQPRPAVVRPPVEQPPKL